MLEYDIIIKKLFVFAIILLFLSINVNTSIGRVLEQSSTLSYDGNTLYVGGSGEGNYTRIQDAIDNASDGDTVFVYNGTYYENIEIKKSINLFGEHRDTTVIDGDGGHMVIYLAEMAFVESVIVSGFTIQNGRAGIVYDTGINNLGSHFFSMKCEHHTSAGFYNNILRNNKVGISVGWWSQHIFLSNNIISNNEYGITFDNSMYCWIYDNTIMDNDNGIYFYYNGYSNDLFKNNISNNKNGIILNYYSTNNWIYENTITENDKGICLYNSDYNEIRDNIITLNNKDCISLFSSDFNFITQNIIVDNGNGINLSNSNYTSINDNTVRHTNFGIYLLNSNRNSIEDNNIIENTNGIYLEKSSWNDISVNILEGNDGSIWFKSHSKQNTIARNDIKNNSKSGLLLDCFCNKNSIHHNVFMKNPLHAYFINSFSNSWNKNFWDNWSGSESKIIYGRIGLIYAIIPWINFDRNPALKPYDIEV